MQRMKSAGTSTSKVTVTIIGPDMPVFVLRYINQSFLTLLELASISFRIFEYLILLTVLVFGIASFNSNSVSKYR